MVQKQSFSKAERARRSAAIAARNFRHGHKRNGRYSSEYIAWQNAKARCTRPGSQAWRNYGARGITMCAEWQADFRAFFRDMGPKPSKKHELDRIDNDRGYEPGNCRWTTRSEQHKNRREAIRRLDGTYTGKVK